MEMQPVWFKPWLSFDDYSCLPKKLKPPIIIPSSSREILDIFSYALYASQVHSYVTVTVIKLKNIHIVMSNVSMYFALNW